MSGFRWVGGAIIATALIIPTCALIFRGVSEGVQDSLGDGTFEEGYMRGAKESVKNSAKGLTGVDGDDIKNLLPDGAKQADPLPGTQEYIDKCLKEHGRVFDCNTQKQQPDVF